jgi:hypothetical protein
MITIDTNEFAAKTQGDWVVKDITEKTVTYQFLLTDNLTEHDVFQMSMDPAIKPVYSSHKSFRLHRTPNKYGLYELDYVDDGITYELQESIAENATSLFNKSMEIVLK